MSPREYMRVTPAQVPELERAGWQVAFASRFAFDSIGVTMVREVDHEAVDAMLPVLCAMASARRDERKTCIALLERAGMTDAASYLREAWNQKERP